MNNGYAQRISLTEAEAIVDAVAARHRPPAAAIALAAARGGVLAVDVAAPIALQPFDNAAMDGFAVRGTDLDPERPTRLRLAGEQFAGRSLEFQVAAGECVRITTGAPLPSGADTVVVRERCREHGGWIEIEPGTPSGANVRRAGEDVAAGAVVLRAGQRLTSPRLGLLAALGLAEVPACPRPRVAVFSGGDELRPAGQPLAAGEIHDSNGPMLEALLAEEGIVADRGRALPDEPAHIHSALREAARDHDLLVTCGGVSAGEKDYLPELLARHGRLHFWRVRIKPGMPLLLGEIEGVPLLGLPGNPVAVLTCFLTLGRRLLDGLEGLGEPTPEIVARLDGEIDKRHPRLEFMRGRLRVDAEAVLRVSPDTVTGSHRLAAAADNDALVVVPEGPCRLPPGSLVRVLPFRRVG